MREVPGSNPGLAHLFIFFPNSVQASFKREWRKFFFSEASCYILQVSDISSRERDTLIVFNSLTELLLVGVAGTLQGKSTISHRIQFFRTSSAKP